jgi:hypothetical protein
LPIVRGAVSGKPLTAPLSGVECVWFKVRVDSWQAHKDLHHRDTVYLHRSGEPVVIGDVRVSPRLLGGEAALTELVSGKRAPTRDEAPFLHLLKDRGCLTPKQLARRAHLLDEIVWETTEYVLLAGAQATARGRLTRDGLLKPSLFGG